MTSGPLGTVNKITFHITRKDEDPAFVGAGTGIDNFREYTSFVLSATLTRKVNELDYLDLEFIGISSGDESSTAPRADGRPPKKPSERKLDISPGNFIYILAGDSTGALVSKIKIDRVEFRTNFTVKVTGFQSAGTNNAGQSMMKNTTPAKDYDNVLVTAILDDVVLSKDSFNIIDVDTTGITDKKISISLVEEQRMNSVKRLSEAAHKEYDITPGTNGVDPYIAGDTLIFNDRIGSSTSTFTIDLSGSTQNAEVIRNGNEVNSKVNDLTVKGVDRSNQEVETNIFLADDETVRNTLTGDHDGYLVDNIDAGDLQLKIQLRGTRAFTVPAAIKIDDEVILLSGEDSFDGSSNISTMDVFRDLALGIFGPSGRGVYSTKQTPHAAGSEVIILYESGAYTTAEMILFDDDIHGTVFYRGAAFSPLVAADNRRRRIKTGFSSAVFAPGDRMFVGSEVFNVITVTGTESTHTYGTGEFKTQRALGTSISGFPVYSHLDASPIRPLELSSSSFTRGSPQAGSAIDGDGVVSDVTTLNGAFTATDMDITAFDILKYKQLPIRRISIHSGDMVDFLNSIALGDKITVNGGLDVNLPAGDFRNMGFVMSYPSFSVELFVNEPETVVSTEATDYQFWRDYTGSLTNRVSDMFSHSSASTVSGGASGLGGGGFWEESTEGIRTITSGMSVLPNGAALLGTVTDPWSNVFSSALSNLDTGGDVSIQADVDITLRPGFGGSGRIFADSTIEPLSTTYNLGAAGGSRWDQVFCAQILNDDGINALTIGQASGGNGIDVLEDINMTSSAITDLIDRGSLGAYADTEVVPKKYVGLSFWETTTGGIRPITSGDDVVRNGTADLGQSGLEWINTYTRSVQGASGINLSIVSNGISDIILIPSSGDTQSFGHFIPDSTDVNDLGNTTDGWRNIYFIGSIFTGDVAGAHHWEEDYLDPELRWRWRESGGSVQTWMEFIPDATNSLGGTIEIGRGGGSPVDVEVQNDFDVLGTTSAAVKAFKIDHPDDPLNKCLIHAAIEGPEYLVSYRGRATIGASGDVTITLPTYCPTLCKAGSFEYILTAIGAYTDLYVKTEMTSNQFVVGGTDGQEFSWTVTAARDDEWAKANPIVVEETKATPEYRHPDLYS